MNENEKTSIIPHSYENTALSTDLRELAARASALRLGARADRTREEYAKAWTAFSAWCEALKIPPGRATVEMVVAYLTHLESENLAPSSIGVAYAAIAYYLRAHDPVLWPARRRPDAIQELLAGIRRKRAHRPDRKEPLTASEIHAAIAGASFSAGLTGLRNRAMVLVGFAGAFRRSEIVALDREDLVLRDDGNLEIVLRRSKVDQEGHGYTKGIARQEDPSACPVVAVASYLKAARHAGTPVDAGPLFRPVRAGLAIDRRLNDRVVARIVKRVVRSIGLDESEFSGHSLRAGFVTTAAENGEGIDAIMRQTGHTRVEQVREYIRHANLFTNNATSGILSKKTSSE